MRAGMTTPRGLARASSQARAVGTGRAIVHAEADCPGEFCGQPPAKGVDSLSDHTRVNTRVDGGAMPVIRTIRGWLAGIRDAFYGGLEEVRFRTGVAVLAGTAAIIGGAATAAVVAVHGGPPAAARRLLDGPAPPPPLAWLPQSTSLARDWGGLAPPVRRAGSASRIDNSSYVASNAPHAKFTPRHGQWALGRRGHLTSPGRHRHGRGPRHHHGRHRCCWGRWARGGQANQIAACD